MSRRLSFAQAINEAMHIAMKRDPKTIAFGLGIDDPKNIFGTTKGLQEDFGAERVFDMPTSEAGMTGIGVGAALGGNRCVMTHQRLDFFLLALDQVVNNAAKWQYMFGGQGSSVSLVMRLILGRGWGQGPTHSQNLQSWFAHIPGLKVVMPSTPADAKGLLLASIFDGNPVIFLEHRWLHQLEGEVPEGYYTTPIGEASIVQSGTDLTIVSLSYMNVEALHANAALKAAGISAELIDLRSVRPIDWSTVFKSVQKTGRLLVLDTSNAPCSVASEVVATVASEQFASLKVAPRRVTLPDVPSPTSPALSEKYYPRAEEILAVIGDMLGRKIDVAPIGQRTSPHDVPGDWFKGPF